jgi:glycosyltransferase involved in cell wall biosynthesis
MRAPQDRFRLLFVGNDFHRKGGPALLQAVSNEFAERCDLTIVSNDPVVEASALPANVKLLRGIVDPKELSAVYNEHDLLVLPTRYDIYPNVLCEALAQATPFLATRLPGIEELAVESGAGWMLPVGATAAQISDAIRALIDDPQKLARARERALSYAQLYLATELLDRKLQEILETQ